jgi:hypothetical protein
MMMTDNDNPDVDEAFRLEDDRQRMNRWLAAVRAGKVAIKQAVVSDVERKLTEPEGPPASAPLMFDTSNWPRLKKGEIRIMAIFAPNPITGRMESQVMMEIEKAELGDST